MTLITALYDARVLYPSLIRNLLVLHHKLVNLFFKFFNDSWHFFKEAI